LVAASIFSISLNPILYRQVDRFDAWASRSLGVWRWLNRRNRRQAGAIAAHDASDPEGRHRAVVIGYGPIGRTVTRLLRENEVEPTIIELNMTTVRRLRESGLDAIYGDAAHRDTLVAAGTPSAGSLILSSAGMSNSEEVIRIAKELNPNIHVLARANFLQERAKLLEARAEEVFSSEGEVALAFAAGVLRRLGATPEQVDRERQWVYADLLGQPLIFGNGLSGEEDAGSASEVAASTSSNGEGP
jgi:CPA2 family monovalent cation:H+ antiporter-2